MHGSTSPSKKRLSAHGVSNSGSRQMTCSRTSPIARRACSLSGSSPNRRSSSSTWKVSVQSCDHAPAAPLAVRRLEREQPRAPALGRDLRPLRGDRVRRLVREVPHHLPADRGIGIEQPVDDVHARGSWHAARDRFRQELAPPRSPPAISSSSGTARLSSGPAGALRPPDVLADDLRTTSSPPRAGLHPLEATGQSARSTRMATAGFRRGHVLPELLEELVLDSSIERREQAAGGRAERDPADRPEEDREHDADQPPFTNPLPIESSLV